MNNDMANIPRKFDTLLDYDLQERRLHLISRNVHAILDEVKRLVAENAPKRIVDADKESEYFTALGAIKTGLLAAIVGANDVDAL